MLLKIRQDRCPLIAWVLKWWHDRWGWHGADHYEFGKVVHTCAIFRPFPLQLSLCAMWILKTNSIRSVPPEDPATLEFVSLEADTVRGVTPGLLPLTAMLTWPPCQRRA